MPQCACGKTAANDCDNGQCGDCCNGCPRHPSDECCEICDMPMHECDCVECNYYDCYCRVPYDSEYCCANCGSMCVDCFGNPYGYDFTEFEITLEDHQREGTPWCDHLTQYKKEEENGYVYAYCACCEKCLGLATW